MSMRRACVISEFSSRAFKNDLTSNKNVLIAQNDQDFANKILQILVDENLNREIANNAEQTIKEKYSYNIFKESIESYLL